MYIGKVTNIYICLNWGEIPLAVKIKVELT